MLKKSVKEQEMQEMSLSANEIFRPLRGDRVEGVRPQRKDSVTGISETFPQRKRCQSFKVKSCLVALDYKKYTSTTPIALLRHSKSRKTQDENQKQWNMTKSEGQRKGKQERAATRALYKPVRLQLRWFPLLFSTLTNSNNKSNMFQASFLN